MNSILIIVSISALIIISAGICWAILAICLKKNVKEHSASSSASRADTSPLPNRQSFAIEQDITLIHTDEFID